MICFVCSGIVYGALCFNNMLLQLLLTNNKLCVPNYFRIFAVHVTEGTGTLIICAHSTEKEKA